jgi:hypothetical protein
MNMLKKRNTKNLLSKARLENSLGELTKKFMYLVRDANGHLVDLNVVSE